MRTKESQLRRLERLLLVVLLPLTACGYLGLANESGQPPTATPKRVVCLPPRDLATAIAQMEGYGSLRESQGTPGAMATISALMTEFSPDEPTCAPGQTPFPSATPDLRTPPGVIIYEEGATQLPLLAPAAGANETMESVKLTLVAEATAGGH